MMEDGKILCGHVIDVLKTLRPNSVDCVVTSPPYYGLRDYGPETRAIWGGVSGCRHQWRTKKIKWHSDSGPGTRKEQADDSFQHKGTVSAYCDHCGAWRGQLGHEPTPNEFVQHLGMVFDAIKRVLKPSGTLWVNLGDTYFGSCDQGNFVSARTTPHAQFSRASRKSPKYKGAGICCNQKPAKSLAGVPERFALEMMDRRWIRRNTIIWHKPTCIPTSATDRFTVDFEYLYFFTKSETYYFNLLFEPLAEGTVKRAKSGFNGTKYDPGTPDAQNSPGKSTMSADNTRRYYAELLEGKHQQRHMRSIWRIPFTPTREKHFAPFPKGLVERPINAGCPPGGVVLDPFAGSGTTGVVARSLGRKFILIDANPEYVKIMNRRLRSDK